MTKVCVLTSGSKGNCTYISDGTTSILIDFGKSYRELCGALEQIGASVMDINAVLITHEHTDHICGLQTLASKQPDLAVFSHEKTLAAVDMRLKTNFSRFARADFDSGFKLGSLFVQPFRTMHDAACPVGYTVESGGKKITSVTDLGIVTPNVRSNALGSELVILESNHDEKMLKNGRYPYPLKQRIMGKFGHLSNDTSAALADELVKNGTRQLILAHLSEENNLPDLAFQTACARLTGDGIKVGEDVTIEIALQGRRTAVHEIK